MVIRIPELKGKLHSKGRVIIPSHTVYNRRNNILTEIIPFGFKLKPRQTSLKMPKTVSKTNKSKDSKSSFTIEPEFNKDDELTKRNTKKNNFVENKTDFVELDDDKECRCSKDIGGTDSENELWNMQLNRWWGWNLQKKRQEHLNKNGYQSGDIPTTSKQENKTVKQHLNQEVISKTYPNLKESHTTRRPSNGFNKQYRGRLKRNKNNEYEGLLREVKINQKSSNEKCVQYLHLRLQNLNCENFPLEKKQYPRKKKNIVNKNINLTTIPELSVSKSSDNDNIISNIDTDSKSSATNQPELISIYQNDPISNKSNESMSKNTVSKTISKRKELNTISIVQDSTLNQLKPVPEISILKPSKSENITKCICTEFIKTKNPISSTVQETTQTEPSAEETHEFDFHKNYDLLKEEHNELLTAICDILCVNNSKSQENCSKLKNSCDNCCKDKNESG